MIKKLSVIVVCVFSPLMQFPTSRADTVVSAAQGKCVCLDLTNPSTADTVQTDSRLRTRSSINTNYKSWLQFDLNAIYAADPNIKGHIASAMLTFTGTGDNTSAKPYVVNGLNDAADMEDWNPANLTWNNAPGNNIADSYLDPCVTTANLYTGTIQPGDGVTDSHSSSALVSFLNTDSDGLVTFIMTPGGTAYFYNAGSAHPPVLTLSMIPGAYYKTYFVATNGNDITGDGSIGSPYKTISSAVGLVSEGDTIYLRGGVHNYSSTITISTSGTEENYITLQNYQDETVILDFSALPAEARGINLNGSYWHLKGFTIRYAGNNGLRVAGSNNIVEQLVTHHNGDTGLHISVGASYNLVLNCDSYLNYDPEENGEDADGFGAKGPTDSLPGEGVGPGNIFSGCRAWSNSDDGFDFWFAGTAVRAENCWAFYNGINIWADPCFAGDGNGFKLGQGAGAHVLVGCLAYGQQRRGIDQNGNVTGTKIYNCTSVANLYRNYYFSTSSSAFVMHNNISYLGTDTIASGVYDTRNTWNSGFSVDGEDFVSLDPNGLEGPRESDGSLPKFAFLRLSPDSPLIDAGKDVGESFAGDAPDLGAFEYIAGDCHCDGDVDVDDLECFVNNWLDVDCGTCNGANFDNYGGVDFYDFAMLSKNWLEY